jgi:hypothetical protein
MRRNKINKKVEFSLKGVRVYVLGGICGLLAILSIFMTIETATSGAEIADLQKKETQLANQQQNIEASLVENLSVNSLQEKSTEMGFTEVNNLVYVSGGIPVARLP